MSDRQLAPLVVLIDTSNCLWHAGTFDASSQPVPLIRSDSGNLDAYKGQPFDEQISFLRHRLAGVLQRGCDRLFSRQMKASHFVLIADGDFPEADESVTPRLAEHFVQWMMNPPVVYLRAPQGFDVQDAGDLEVIAGDFPTEIASTVQTGLSQLVTLQSDSDLWERIATPQR
ncbi:hypothetical protein SH528x_002795 [Novipirellula sp. SH528]|uniref:hypothetical protein n=1 Tax=Novipirellula sp. SH528 TaxID=3454466 RepID=UPI003FA015BB